MPSRHHGFTGLLERLGLRHYDVDVDPSAVGPDSLNDHATEDGLEASGKTRTVKRMQHPVRRTAEVASKPIELQTKKGFSDKLPRSATKPMRSKRSSLERVASKRPTSKRAVRKSPSTSSRRSAAGKANAKGMARRGGSSKPSSAKGGGYSRR